MLASNLNYHHCTGLDGPLILFNFEVTVLGGPLYFFSITLIVDIIACNLYQHTLTLTLTDWLILDRLCLLSTTRVSTLLLLHNSTSTGVDIITFNLYNYHHYTEIGESFSTIELLVDFESGCSIISA